MQVIHNNTVFTDACVFTNFNTSGGGNLNAMTNNRFILDDNLSAVVSVMPFIHSHNPAVFINNDFSPQSDVAGIFDTVGKMY